MVNTPRLVLFLSFAVAAAGVALVAVAWNDPHAVLGWIAQAGPQAADRSMATKALLVLLLVFGVVYALLFRKIRRDESVIETQDVELRGYEQSLREHKAALDHEAAWRGQAKRVLDGNRELFDSVERLQTQMCDETIPGNLFASALGDLLRLSESGCGFIGELDEGAGGRHGLRTLAVSNIEDDDKAWDFLEKHAFSGFREDLFAGDELLGDMVVFPALDERRVGEGVFAVAPPFQTYLGFPLRRGRQIVGVVGLANRASGYDRELANRLRPLVAVCNVLLAARRARNEHKRTQERLDEALRLGSGEFDRIEGLKQELAAEKHAGEALRRTLDQLERRFERQTEEFQEQAAKAERAEGRATAIQELTERSVRAKAEFVASVCRDLRTPLISIVGLSDQALKPAGGVHSASRSREYIEYVNDTALELLDLIRETLALSGSGNENVDLTPGDAVVFGHYAGLSARLGKDRDLAEALFQRAIMADPGNAVTLGNYSFFRTALRKDHERVDALYQRALAAEPDNAMIAFNYAIFLSGVRKQHDAAEKLFQRAIAIRPDDTPILAGYAAFLARVRQDHEQAEAFYRRAIAAAPDNSAVLGDYARFLWETRGDREHAEEFFRRAIAVSPGDPGLRLAYAAFLLFHGEADKGLGLIEGMISVLWGETLLQARFFQYAYGRFEMERAEALKLIHELFDEKIRSISFDPFVHVRHLAESGHPEPELLDALARVIAVREDVEALDRFPAWRIFELLKPRPQEVSPAPDGTAKASDPAVLLAGSKRGERRKSGKRESEGGQAPRRMPGETPRETDE